MTFTGLQGVPPGGVEPLPPKEVWALDGQWKPVKGAWVQNGGFWKPLLQSSITLLADTYSSFEGNQVVLTPHVSLQGLLASLHWEYRKPGSASWEAIPGAPSDLQPYTWQVESAGRWDFRVKGNYTEDRAAIQSEEISVSVASLTLSTSISAASAVEGDPVTLTATASASELVSEYHWEWMLNSSGTWTRWTSTVASSVQWTTHTPGTWRWRAVARRTDGGEVVSSNEVVLAVTLRHSTGTVTGKTWVMSYLSGDGEVHGANQDFSFTLSNPAAVSRVTLEVTPWLDPPPWKAIGIWTEGGDGGFAAIPGAAWDWAFASSNFDSIGMWSAKIKITQKDGTVLESGHFPFEVRKKRLTATASTLSPVVNDPLTLYAACEEGCHIPYKSANWQANWGTGWHTHGGPGENPAPWTGAWGNVDFRWVEWFEDGSYVCSPSVAIRPVERPPQPPQPSPYHIRAGYSQADIQHVFNSRAGQQILIEPATYHITSGKLQIPDGVHIVAHGSTFIVHQGIINAGGGGGYGRAGGWTWEGGTFDGWLVRTTMFSVAHARSFTITGVTIHNCVGGGHAIEINSSGGPVQGGYTIGITNNVFDGVGGHRGGQGSYDEAIHIDYAWGGGAATANPANDGTVTNNLWVAGNVVEHRYPHSPTGYPVAFGAHKFSCSEGSKKDSNGNWVIWNGKTHNADGEARPVAYHTHFLIEGNHFNVAPYSGTVKRGGIHLRGMNDVVIRNNHVVSPSGRGPITHDAEYTKNVHGPQMPVNT